MCAAVSVHGEAAPQAEAAAEVPSLREGALNRRGWILPVRRDHGIGQAAPQQAVADEGGADSRQSSRFSPPDRRGGGHSGVAADGAEATVGRGRGDGGRDGSLAVGLTLAAPGFDCPPAHFPRPNQLPSGGDATPEYSVRGGGVRPPIPVCMGQRVGWLEGNRPLFPFREG